MSKQPPAEPEHVEYEDHSVIVPPHGLKSALFHTSEPGDIPMDVVERAEAALATLEGEFTGWMQAECDRLDAACSLLRQTGPTKIAMDMLFRASQDIKGDAATLGYPIAGQMAASLCRIVYHAPDPSRISLDLIDRYVEAVRAVVRENVRNPYDPTAIELADQLGVLAEKFLAAELQDDYAEIAGDAAPPLVVPEEVK